MSQILGKIIEVKTISSANNSQFDIEVNDALSNGFEFCTGNEIRVSHGKYTHLHAFMVKREYIPKKIAS